MRFDRLLLASLFFIPILVLIGWFSGNDTLKSVVPGFTPMNPLTAVIFLVLAISLWAKLTHKKFSNKLIHSIGIFIIAVGGLMVLKYTLGIDLHLDRILFHDQLDANRIAPNTALNFILVGIIFLLHSLKIQKILIWLVGANAFISTLSIIGYTYGLKQLFGIAEFNPMAIHTAFCFLILDVLIVTILFNIKLYVGKRIVISLFLALTIVTLISLTTQESLRRVAARQVEEVQIVRVIEDLSKLESSLVSAETGQRGYLLTSEEKYLEPYTESYAAIPAILADLKGQLSTQDEYNTALQSIESSIQLKLGELQNTIELKRQGRAAEALAIVQSDVGKRYLDTFRTESSNLNTKLRADLSANQAQGVRSQNNMKWILAIGATLNSTILFILFLFIQRAIAQRVKAEEKQEANFALLQNEKKKLQTILSSTGDAVFVINSKSEIILFNQAAEELSGYSEKDAIGQKYSDVLQFTYESSGELNDDFIQTALGGKKASMANHTHLKHKNGDLISVADSAAPFMNASGKVEGVIVVFRDVTHDRKLERAKDEFVSIASHQLRTPATAVKQFLGLIREGYVTPDSKDAADLINQAYDSNEEQLQLVTDLLNIAQLEAGSMSLTSIDTNISDLVHEIRKRQTVILKTKKQKIEITGANEKVSARIDMSLLRTAIDNLISNASKYSPDGSVIKLGLTSTTHAIQISVEDQGIGISDTDKSKLFKRFSRLHNVNEKQISGTGLGLYLCKLIVELHKGKIAVESKVGHGTKFIIELPK